MVTEQLLAQQQQQSNNSGSSNSLPDPHVSSSSMNSGGRRPTSSSSSSFRLGQLPNSPLTATTTPHPVGAFAAAPAQSLPYGIPASQRDFVAESLLYEHPLPPNNDDENGIYNNDDDDPDKDHRRTTWEEEPTEGAEPPSHEEELGTLQAFVVPSDNDDDIMEAGAGGGRGRSTMATAVAQPKDELEDGFFTKKRIIMVCGLVCIVIIALVVGISVGLASGGGNDGKNGKKVGNGSIDNPGTSASSTCFDSIKDLIAAMHSNSLLNQEDEVMEYILCPNRKYEIEGLTNPSNVFTIDKPPLVVQSNTHIKCGHDGDMSNGCLLTNANTLSNQDVLLMNKDTGNAVKNVVFEGLTFEPRSRSPFMVGLDTAGDITFRNCFFKVRLIDLILQVRGKDEDFLTIFVLFDQSDTFPKSAIRISFKGDRGNPSVRQTVKFEGCIFWKLEFGKNTADDAGEFTTLITAQGSANTVIFHDCIFRDNSNRDPSVSKRRPVPLRVVDEHKSNSHSC